MIKSKIKNIIVRITALTCTVLLCLGPGLVFGQDPRLDNIIVTNTSDDLLIYLTAKDAFPAKIVEAIHSGVPATFTFFINLYRVRSFYPDKRITDLQLTHSMKYDSLKKEYIISRSWEDRRPLTTKSLAEAQKLMTEVDSLRIVALNRLEKGRQYQIRVKAELNKMTLPFYLHYVLFFVSFWDLETDWYTIDFIY